MSTLHRPLFSLIREGYEEVLVHGELAISYGDRPAIQVGVNGSYPARSLLKPFQFLATGLPLETWKNNQRFAAAVGSVSATPDQVEQLLAWYRGSPLLDSLKVPAMYPMDDLHRLTLREQRKPPQQWYHTCYSKHLAILQSCVQHQWPLDSYLEVKHPFFQRVSAMVCEWSGITGPLKTVTDGCGLPSPILSLSALAHLYRRLAGSEGLSKAVVELMAGFPEWIGGPGRLDTRVMQMNHGALIAKEGADGLWAIAARPSSDFPGGIGIVLKLAPGYQPALAKLALRKLASHLKFEVPGETPSGQELVFHYDVDR